MKTVLSTALLWLVLLSPVLAAEPLQILHNMRFADPTGANLNPWLFSREKGNAVGGVFVQALFHNHIFSSPGVIDFEKLKGAAKRLKPGPVMLNVEGKENRCFDLKTLKLIQENVQRRIEIVQCVRRYGPPGLEIGFYGSLPPCAPWLVTGIGQHVKDRPHRREAWERLVHELIPLSKHVDCCFLSGYASSKWHPEAVLWHIRRTVWAAREVYCVSAYPVFFVTGWYPEWSKVPNEALAQMENRIPGDVFESWLQEAERSGAKGVLLFGDKATDGTFVDWDSHAGWWRVVRQWTGQ